jgi:hypothetical protein
MGVRVGGIVPARVAPSSEIPIDGAGACDQVHDGRLVGRPIRVERMRGVFPHLGLRLMTQTIKIRFTEPQIVLVMRAYPNCNLDRLVKSDSPRHKLRF